MSSDLTSNDLIPLKMCSAVVTLDQYMPGWTLAEIVPESTPKQREFEYYIPFEQSFPGLPLVHIGITGFDIDNRDTGRLSTSIKDISSDGFTLLIHTWMHTRVYRVDLSWIALGSA